MTSGAQHSTTTSGIPGLVGSLQRVVGAAHVLVDDDMRAGYERDWTGRWVGRSAAVVRPGSAEEVAAVLGVCRAAGVAVVPQGGNTGLVGGSVPTYGEVVLSTQRLDVIGAVDTAAAQVTVGAGATLAALQEHVGRAGFAFAVDLGARDRATIGGMVATNAGGIHVLRHGMMRAQVVGVEAVLGDGTVVRHLGGLLKDNTGYDLAGLLTGSEGTLGVITAVRLRLVARPAARVAAALGVGSLTDAVTVVARLRDALPMLEAAEVMRGDGVAMVAEHTGVPVPPVWSAPFAVLVECASNEGAMSDDSLAEAMAAALGGSTGGLLRTEPVVALTPATRAALWALRERHTETIGSIATARGGAPIKLDVTLPLAGLGAFDAAVDEVVRAALPADVASGAVVYVFGHVADGNVHVNVVGVPEQLVDAVEDAVLRAVAERGGSISAEHGIGQAKRRWLHLCRSDAEVAAFRAIKAALDPAEICNPHVLLP